MRKKLIVVAIAVIMVIALAVGLTSCYRGIQPEDYIRPTLKSANLIDGATITHESLAVKEKADAKNMLSSDKKAWTPQDMMSTPAKDQANITGAVAEIKLKSVSTFNTAIIEEIGNEVQYFRLLAWVNDEWVTVYRSEKIQSLRLMSFDAVTTDRVRLIIDKWRDQKTPAKIKSIGLYNEPKRDTANFNVTAYQRIDVHGDVPSEVLTRSEAEIDAYARFYDVYNTVIVFGAVNWNSNGDMTFGLGSKEAFVKEIEALKQIIARRSNKTHEVKIVCTSLADGAFGADDKGDTHNGVNVYMAQHYERVADQMIEFMKEVDIDGLDIDWEYPRTKDDWAVYDKFITRLDDAMHAYKPSAVLSAALSAGALGMSQETLDRFDQIQYMAYDGHDEDGYQSSLDQAQYGLVDFVNNGAKLSQINIGIAAYGRPVEGGGYWPTWRDLEQANYWDSRYYNVECSGQLFDAAYCSPALAGDKTAYALMTGVGGVMVFRMGCDKTMDDPNSVACGIENALKRYSTNY